MAYSALKYATAMIQAAPQRSQPRRLAGTRVAIIAPMIEKRIFEPVVVEVGD
jgi:hypothetical protein